MAFPIITLLLAALVAFLAFQTGSIDNGLAGAAAPPAEEAPAEETPVEEPPAEE